MSSGPRIGVVTVTFNSGAVLQRFLQCAAGQTLGDYVLYAVDNASQDETLQILRAVTDPRLRLIVNHENLGFAEGTNQGIVAALAEGCEAVLLLNNDTEFSEGLFVRLADGLREYQCLMTTAKMLYFDSPQKIWCAGGELNPRRFFGALHHGMNETDDGRYDRPHRVTYTPGCCILIDRSVFAQVGMLDARYFVYNEDADFLYRCLKLNLPLWYIPDAVLYHKVSSLTGGDNSDFSIRYMTRNRAYFIKKHLPMRDVLLWGGHFVAVTALRRVLSGRESVRVWWLRCTSMMEGFRAAHE